MKSIIEQALLIITQIFINQKLINFQQKNRKGPEYLGAFLGIERK